jgi:hypothetical protein
MVVSADPGVGGQVQLGDDQLDDLPLSKDAFIGKQCESMSLGVVYDWPSS